MEALDNLYRIRSTSLPTRSHPLSVRFEEELQKVKAIIVSTAKTTTPPPEILHHQLRRLESLYGCLENLLRMPSAQQALARKRQQKWAVEEMDLSVALLDISGSLKDALCLISSQVKDCQSALRTRKVGDPAFEEKLLSFICCRKKARKDVDKCLVALKRMGGRCLAVSSVPEKDQEDFSLVATALNGVRLVTVEIYQLISLCIAGSSKSRSRVWGSMFSKSKEVLKKGWGDREQWSSEMQEVLDYSIQSLYRNVLTKTFDAELNQKVLNQLRVLESGVDRLESGLDALFRRIMHHRVSLLNMVSS